MLQNARVTAFTVSGLLKEQQQGGVKPPPSPLPTQIRAKNLEILCSIKYCIFITFTFKRQMCLSPQLCQQTRTKIIMSMWSVPTKTQKSQYCQNYNLKINPQNWTEKFLEWGMKKDYTM